METVKVGGPELVRLLGVIQQDPAKRLVIMGRGGTLRLEPYGKPDLGIVVPTQGRVKEWDNTVEMLDTPGLVAGVRQGRFQLILELEDGLLLGVHLEDMWIGSLWEKHLDVEPHKPSFYLVPNSLSEVEFTLGNSYYRFSKLPNFQGRFDIATGEVRVHDRTLLGSHGALTLLIQFNGEKWVWTFDYGSEVAIPDNDPIAWFQEQVDVDCTGHPGWNEAQSLKLYDRTFWLWKIYNQLRGPGHLTIIYEDGYAYFWEETAELAGTERLPINEAVTKMRQWVTEGRVLRVWYDEELTYEVKKI